MADNLSHEPESGHDKLESLFEEMRNLLQSIDNKLGAKQGTSEAPPAEQPTEVLPAHQPNVSDELRQQLGGAGRATPITTTPSPEVAESPAGVQEQIRDILLGIANKIGVENKTAAAPSSSAPTTEFRPSVSNVLPTNLEVPGLKDREQQTTIVPDYFNKSQQAAPPIQGEARRGKKTTRPATGSKPTDMFGQAGLWMKRIGGLLDQIGFAQGGPTGGQRPPGPTDTISAKLSPGEYVLTPTMVDQLGVENLEQLRGGGQVTGPLAALADKEDEQATGPAGAIPAGTHTLSRKVVGKFGLPHMEQMRAGFQAGGPVGFAGGGLSAGQAIQKGGAIATALPGAMSGNPGDIWTVIKESVVLFVDNVKAFGRHIQDMGKAADKFMTSDRLEDQAMAGAEGSEAAQKFAVRGMANIVGGPIGGAILGPIMEKIVELNPINQFTKAMITAVATLRNWNDALHNANMKFAEFSGSMAAVQARQQFRDITLSMTRGERRAGTAEDLAEARHELNERFSVVEDALANFKNAIVAKFDRLLVGVIDNAPIISEVMQWLRDMMGEPNIGPGQREMAERANKNWDRFIKERRAKRWK